MICIDTTVLIDEFRARGDVHQPVNQALLRHAGETLLIAAVAAGEFLDGAAMVSEIRLQQSLVLMRSRNIVPITLETAEVYGRFVSQLRKEKDLSGRSQNDLWIAATARTSGARLLTRNPADFNRLPGLEVLRY
ncbi:MAG: type II toxin-antitoxin system VapC family toxin [Kiritimatiellae bacterium]|nr:type II toxin-antitoxin system VapC family toxin [Kiritimatiellia bacterium]